MLTSLPKDTQLKSSGTSQALHLQALCSEALQL